MALEPAEAEIELGLGLRGPLALSNLFCSAWKDGSVSGCVKTCPVQEQGDWIFTYPGVPRKPEGHYPGPRHPGFLLSLAESDDFDEELQLKKPSCHPQSTGARKARAMHLTPKARALELQWTFGRKYREERRRERSLQGERFRDPAFSVLQGLGGTSAF